VSDPRRLIRRLSALFLVVWLAVLTATLVHRQLRHSTSQTAVELPEPTDSRGEKPLRVHRGFIFSDSLGVEPNFRISASQTVEYASGWVELRDVELSLYEGGRVAYGLVGERGRFNQARREAEISGGAQLSLKAGIAVRAGAFRLHGPDRILESIGPVTFAGMGWGGVAGKSRVSLTTDVIELLDGVTVTARQSAESQPSAVLLAPTVVYERRRFLIRFPQGLTILRAGLRARAAGGELQLTEPEGTLNSAVFADPVRLDGVTADGAAVQGEAGVTRLSALEKGRWHLTAEPSSALGWVRGWWQEADRSWREMTAWRLVGEGTERAWEWLEGQGLACVSDYSPGAEPRAVQAERIRLAFVGGQPETGEAHGSVTVTSGLDTAQGGDLDFSLSSKSFSLLPSSGERVTATSPDGMTRADRMEGSDDGSLVARGQVSGTLRGGELWSGGEGPVNFAADRATVSRDRTKMTLAGEARLWQGDRLVAADTVEYDATLQQVAGNGNVLTSTQEDAAGGGVQTIRVRARAFSYDRAASVATYDGNVVLDEPRAVSRSQRLVAILGPKGQLLLATLSGGVEVTENGTGRTVRGERARLTPNENLYEIWGSPVIAEEPSGNQVKADHLLWRRDSNTMLVLGGPDNPSETLYHPTKALPIGKPQPQPQRSRGVGGTPTPARPGGNGRQP
jgi:lipopolysaccharide export system protein LptA